jgi:hypothetical protein
MEGQVLHIYAVNERIEATHTYLSRSQGQVAELPDLSGWLGLGPGGLVTDEIELFATGDLAGMSLTDYISTAFDLEAAPDVQTAARLNALDGHVLIAPEAAVSGNVTPQPQVTHIASLRVAQADHSANVLEPAPARSAPETPGADPAPRTGGRRISALWVIGVCLAVLALLAYLVLG